MYGNLIAVQKNASHKLIATPSFFQPYLLEESEGHATEEVTRDLDANTLRHFRGKRSRSKWNVPIHFSPSLTASLLRDTLKRSVEVIYKPIANDAKILRSIPLDSLLKVMMVESDNHIAEQLLLQCAAILSDTLQPEIAIQYTTKKVTGRFTGCSAMGRWVRSIAIQFVYTSQYCACLGIKFIASFQKSDYFNYWL